MMSKQYDPMTGELIDEAAEAAEEPTEATDTIQETIIGYDPMTGEPIMGNKNTNVEVPRFDPMTEKPNNNKIIFIALGVVAALAIIIFAGIKSGAFLSKSNQVLLAMANTVKEQSHLTKNLAAFGKLTSNDYTVNVEVEDVSSSIELQYSSSRSEKQLLGSVSYLWIPDIDFAAGLTASQLKLQIPSLDDRVFTYNYVEEKDGYITEVLAQDEIEVLDMLLDLVYSSNDQQSISEDMVKIILDEYRSLKYEKVDKEEFEVNGKDRKCKGYKTTFTEDNWLNIIDGIENIYLDNYDNIILTEMEIFESFEDTRDSIEELEDIDFTFYIYKNQLACITMDSEGEEYEILFKGNENGLHNIEFVSTDYGTLMELKSSIKKNEEIYKLIVEGDEVAKLNYDYKTGDFELEWEDYYSQTVIVGNFQSNSKELTMTIDSFEEDEEDMDTTIAIFVKKGATTEKISGEEYDLGNASETDLYELVEDIGSALGY